MIFVPTPASPPDVEAAESYPHSAPAEAIATVEPKWLKRQQYVYRRTLLPIEGGRLLLRLTQTPVVEVDPLTRQCDVIGWDLRMPCDKVEDLPREMAHRFLDLFSKSDRNELTETEYSTWLQMVDQIDFAGFTIDRAAPHYLEAKLERLDPVCIVEWHDGSRQRIGRDVAQALRVLRPGERFGAYVKLGKENEVLSIERIVLIASDGE